MSVSSMSLLPMITKVGNTCVRGRGRVRMIPAVGNTPAYGDAAHGKSVG